MRLFRIVRKKLLLGIQGCKSTESHLRSVTHKQTLEPLCISVYSSCHFIRSFSGCTPIRCPRVSGDGQLRIHRKCCHHSSFIYTCSHCLSRYAMCELSLRTAIRARVSCWLLSSQGTVDLLSPLCCLLKPSCPGCFFAIPPAQERSRLFVGSGPPKRLFISPPMSAFEACRLIERAKDKMEDLKGSLSSAPTL